MSLKNIDLDEDMEAPCLCDCGAWFDLDNGYPSPSSDQVICKTCYEFSKDEENEEDDSEEF